MNKLTDAGVEAAFASYVATLRETPASEKTEHTDREAIKPLLKNFTGTKLTIVHEPKRVPGKGAPDFKVRHNGQIVGYLETKALGSDLKAILKSDQIERYRSLSKNILLTNYLDWVWIRGDSIQSGTLCKPEDLSSKKTSLDRSRIEIVADLLRGFVSTPPERIKGSYELAVALAGRSRILRDFLGDELKRQERDEQGERLYGLFSAFRKQVSENITLPEFADAFAQTLSYGLFLSKLNANGYSLNLTNAKQYIPSSFKLIQELVSFIDVLDVEYYRDVKWVVDEILSIINGLDIVAVKNDLSFRNRKRPARFLKAQDEHEWRLFSRDPFIYFYEDYLSQYDPEVRKSRGVYYTPPPVVNFIIRGVDDILKKTFNLPNGLADHNKVTFLDFACGTGTFMVEAIERVIENLGSATGKIGPIVKDHVLKNFYAFEYLVAPYTIAHLKLSQYFEDRQIKIGANQRFNIFLTNTLEPIEPQKNFLLPALSEEAERALHVKKQPILVITGNPPYSAHSKNTGEWITDSIEAYKQVDGKHFGERKHWLHDDYVKFIRFAQMKMDAVTEGVVAVITNHSYLDNPTFRGMRQSLMKTFDQIWIFDLHGNTKKKEHALDGSKDENVFDIEQGVAIALFVRRPGAEKGIWHSDLWGNRSSKYQALADGKMSSVSWEKLAPSSPFYFFRPLKEKGRKEYDSYWAVPEIFPTNVAGVITARDHFAVAFDRDELRERISKFTDLRITDKTISEDLDLHDTRGWSLSKMRRELAKDKKWDKSLRPILYRPFDKRIVAYDPRLIDWGRWELLRHMLQPNIAISLIRKVDISRPWEHVLACDGLTTHHTVSMKEVNYVFPLFLYPPEKGSKFKSSLFETADPFAGKTRIENIAPKFRTWLDDRYKYHYAPEAIFGFIYGVLHSPTFRKKYSEFLRIDFPRVPFPEKRPGFDALSKLGTELADAHLLRRVPTGGLAHYKGNGDNEVEKVRYEKGEQAVYINANQRFSVVPPEAWNFHIGGYQVLDKYLKSRKGRALTLDEIDNVANIVKVLAFSVSQIEKIEKAYLTAFS